MPGIVDLDRAIVARSSIPAVIRLGGGSIILTGSRQPLRLIRDGSVTYLMRQEAGPIVSLTTPIGEAVDEDWLSRYRGLTSPATLRRLHGSATSPLPAWVSLNLDGLLIPTPGGSTQWPVVAMPWPEGRRLFDAVAKAASDGDRGLLQQLAEGWRRLVASMAAARLIHGDLSADEVWVEPSGQLSLINFDHCWWPGLRVARSTGLATAYRHPKLGPDQASDDAFAALLMLVSLMAISERPQLRRSFGDLPSTPGGGLLFTAADLLHADHAPIFAELTTLQNPMLLALVGVLREATEASGADIPPLENALQAARKVSQGVLAPNRRSTLSVVREDAAPPVQIETAALEADAVWQRAEAIHRLKQALTTADDAAVANLWPQVRDEPAAAMLAIDAEQAIARNMAARITQSIERGDDHQIIKIVDEADRLGIALSVVARRAARAARHRLDRGLKLEQAVASGDSDVLRDLVTVSDPDHANQRVDEITRRRIRSNLIAQDLRLAVASDDDAAILQVIAQINQPVERVGLDEVSQKRIELAVARTGWLERIRQAIKSRDASVIAEGMSNIPPGAIERMSKVERRRLERILAPADGKPSLPPASISATRPIGHPPASAKPLSELGYLTTALSLEMASAEPDVGELARYLPAILELLSHNTELRDSVDPGLIASADRLLMSAAHRTRLQLALAGKQWQLIAGVAFPDPYGIVPTLPLEQQALILKAMEKRADQFNLKPERRSMRPGDELTRRLKSP